MMFKYVIAAGKTGYLSLIKLSGFVISNILYAGTCILKISLFDKLSEMIAFTGCPFFIYKQSKSVLKRKL